MEVSRRRFLLKHLEPARPLRRCAQVDVEPQINAGAYAETLMKQETDPGIEQFYKIVNLQKQRQDRISYTRDFLIGLASCPEAKKRPKFLPAHPIVLPVARDSEQLELRVTSLSAGEGDA